VTACARVLHAIRVLRCVLFAALAATAPEVQVPDGTQIDSSALRRGLDVRLGEAGRGWFVQVLPTQSPEVVHLQLRAPDGREVHRSILLEGEGVEQRSRELASATALIIEGHEQAQPPDDPDARPEDPRPLLGWVAAGTRVGLGPTTALDPDYGLSARGGLWVAREHVQPIASFGWSRSAEGSLVLDAVRIGAGAAFGAPLAGRLLWLGAGAIPHAAWTRAVDRRRVARWRSSTELSALLQVRGRWGLIGLRSGLDLTLPPVRAVGSQNALRWGVARFVIGLEIALILPPTLKSAP
jgi:hypothetical protein